MSVDIDIGGAKFEDLGEEEEDILSVEAEEVEVLEQEPIEPPIRPLKAPPSAVKKPSRFVKPILIVVVIIVLIFVVMIAILFFGTEVSNVNVALDKTDPDNLEVTVLVSTTGTAGISGEGDLKIEYQDDVIYNTKVNINDDGNGYKSVPYNDFVEGNGNYYVTVEYKGKKSPPAEYKVSYIVESLNISVDVGRFEGQGQLNLTIYMLDKNGLMMADDPEKAELTVKEIVSLDDGTIIAYNESPFTTSERSYKMDFPYSTSGNYSITVSLVNTKINPNSGSIYYTIEETRVAFLNIIPIADTSVDYTEVGIFYNVEFDASLSWNDGGITLYIWDFNNDGNIDDETTSPQTSTTYPITTSQVEVNLNVVGDIIDPVTGELERGARTITITF